jgi:tetratricopeptide (TPR) repeat protein
VDEASAGEAAGGRDPNAGPHGTTAGPHGTTADPHGTTAGPHGTTADPQEMTAGPQDMTAASHGTTAGQHNTIAGGASLAGPVVQARDISGGIHVHAYGARAEPPPPRQLLPPPHHFTGRDADLRALDALRAAQPRALIVVSGAAGVGKTALVSRWLGGLCADHPAGQLYADLKGHADEEPADPGAVLGQFLRAFGVDQVPAALAEQAALWRTLTAARAVAVHLDNAYSAAQVRQLVPASPAALTVVTSRRRLTALGVDGAAFHQVEVLDPAAAVELLSRRLGRERVTAEPETAYRLARLCGGLPLALCVAAARGAARPRQPLSALTRAMSGESRRLTALAADGDLAVRTALDHSYAALPPGTAAGYRRLGLLFTTDFGRDAVAAVCALPPDRAEELIDELVEVNLLEELGEDRVRLHDLVRLHALERAAAEEPPQEREAAVRRVLDWYLASATAAKRLLAPALRRLRRDYAGPPPQPRQFADADDALAWLDAEQARLMAAVRTAAERGLHATAWQLVDSMQPLFLRLRPYDLWTEAHRVGLAAAEQAGHPEGVSQMLTTGAGGLCNAGLYDEAADWLGRAVDGARRDGDRRAEAQALHGLARSHRLAGRLERATALFRQALAIREAIGHTRGAALTRLCLGDIALDTGDPAQAIALLTRARADLLAVPDPYDAARALAFLGRAHAADGVRDFATAERQLHEALEEFARAGSVHWQARVVEMLGQTAADRGDTEGARDRYEQSLARYAPVSPSDARRLEARLRALAEH